jgi:tRNA A-37 threonylcarbamoyl transferase component Bud32
MTDIGSVKTLVDEKERVSLGKSTDDSLVVAPLEPRYADQAILGEGGMGEVRLVRDTVVGRDVAIKRVRGLMAHDGISRERFLREARIQGQLEHPAIVPVYDLAMTPDERIYFTMRRVRGRAFEGDARLSRHALLSAMSRVCLAIDFAHARGVVHRDIKPANLMLGDWGEVYVLDWGLAKLTGSDDPLALASSQENEVIGSGKTTIGSILGTPGYMAPEQARGDEVDARADVYALGACLFEALAGEPLVEIGPARAMIGATLAGANARISARVPHVDVPVELEAICVRATMTSPDDRYQTAREMSDAIERFLEGDRDLERRRARAREHAATANALVASATERGETAARSDAMREVGRALANDPDNADARRALVRLLTEPPARVPPEVEAEMARDRDRLIATARQRVALAFLSALVPNIVIALMGVRDLPWFMVGSACGFVGAAAAAIPSHVFLRERRLFVALLAMGGLVSNARVASPLVVVPVMALCLGVGLTLFPRKTNVGLAILAAAVCIALPFALEWTGVVSRTFHASGDAIVIDARLCDLPAGGFLVWFFIATLLPIAATCFYLAHVRDRLTAAEERLRLQAWQLKQILPPT